MENNLNPDLDEPLAKLYSEVVLLNEKSKNKFF
jgi:hypothetical protein